MRLIANLPDEKQARTLGDFLVTKGIRNNLEHDGGGSWSVWIVEEDRVGEAQSWLERFHANPNALEFRNAQTEAAKAREAEAKDLAEYRKRVRTRRSLFPGFDSHGVGILTYVMIFACVVVAIYSDFGEKNDFLRHLLIADPETNSGFLSEVRAGEVWRLFTPIFIHFGVVHLLFNMMWLYQLGCMIEGRQSTWVLAALVAVIALCSNLAELYFTHHIKFGGMSGVVYGLAGYVWIRGKFDRKSGLFLDSQSLTILLVWLVVCYANILPVGIANTAHTVGLIVGVIWGRLSAYLAFRKPE